MKKRKSPHNEITLDRILHFAMYSTWFLILLFCLLVFKCTSHASSGDNTAYFPMGQNDNNLISDEILSYIESQIDATNNYYALCYRYDAYDSKFFWFYTFPKTTENAGVYFEIYNNGYQFRPYQSGNVTVSGGELQIPYHMQWCNKSYYAGALNYWGVQNSSLYDNTKSYVSNYRVMTSNNDNASVVLKYGWELPPDFMHDTSHATPPDTFESPVYTTGHTPPTNVPPTYTINNYTWTTYTPPTIDTSNAETLLESIYNAIVYNGQYLKDNIHGELTNLVDNIGGFFEYIGDTIQYYGNLIISNIQNGITTFYNNINSAIVGIGDAVGYITQPLDMENLTNAVNSTHIWGDVGTCTSYASDAFGIYGTVAEPNTFKIPLDLRSISLLNITQVYYIDLSWLDDAKQAIRAFIWCIVTFGLLYSVIVDIPNMIRSSK